jgi:hypothetical protein
MQVAVGIDVNHPRAPVVGETQVHAAIIPTSERLERGERCLDHSKLQLGREAARNRGAVDALG